MLFFQIRYILFLLCIHISSYAQLYSVDAEYLNAWKKAYSLNRQQKAKDDTILRRKQADSIKRLITGAPDDTFKVKRLLDVCRIQYFQEDPTNGFASDALLLSEKIHFKQGIASAYNMIGILYESRKDSKTAIQYFQKAIDESETNGSHINSINFYNTLLNRYFYLADYPHAMETISREMGQAERSNDKIRIAHCNNIFGYIYFKQESFEESEKYYGRYINNVKELNDSPLLVHALGELVDVYIAEKKYRQSINTLNTILRICDQVFVNRGVFGSMTDYKAKALYRLSKTYNLTGELQKALHYSLEALKLIPLSYMEYEIASYYINAGDVYKELKEYDKAIAFLSYGYILSNKIQHRENTRDAAKFLSQTYAIQSRYDSAFYFYKLYTSLKDSIVNNETKMKVAGIQGQYDIAKKDKEITRQQQIRNLLIAGFIVLLMMLFLLYNGYRLQQKNKYQQEHSRQQNELFNAIVTTQDQERKRIAQDIHDSLGSVLSAAKLKLSSLEESTHLFSLDQLEKYKTSLALLDEASSELRNISHNIMPATLSKLGIVAALQSLIDKLSTHAGLQISFTAHSFDTRIEETTEISIYRIILELINNIVKHALADKVSIQMIKYPGYINLVIEDNGRGFNYDKALAEKKGIGLGNILSRVEYLNGTLEIDSKPGKGTTVIIEIPYQS